MREEVLRVDGLKVWYSVGGSYVKAVDGVSFTVYRGEVFGIAGESGCGKSTLVSSLVLLKPPMRHMGGRALFHGKDLFSMSGEELRKIRYKGISIIPQFALDALSPTKRIRDIILDLAAVHEPNLTKREVLERAEERLRLVSLSPKVLDMYPVELSGGMRQRAVLVVSTLFNPELLIADEVTSALDVTTQRVVLELLLEFLKAGIIGSIVAVTHDIASLYQIADRMMIMYAGKVVEIGPAEELVKRPRHPYTQALISSIPSLGVTYKEKRLSGLKGSPPNLRDPPPGCRFAPRCPYAFERCGEEPPAVELGGGHVFYCWLGVR